MKPVLPTRRWGRASCLACVLTIATVSAAVGGEQAATGHPTGDDPFWWLAGRWAGPDETLGGLYWTEPNRLGRPRKWKESERTSRVRLELTFTNTSGGLGGALDAVAADGKKTTTVTFAIARSDGDCVLTWQEGGTSYRLGLDGTRGSYRLAPGDIERSSGERFFRFSRGIRLPRRGSSAGRAYPIIIEFRMLGGQLTLRRVQGPQHGAAIEQQYQFERPAAYDPAKR